ncbi:hypothetical protein VP1G_00172 [Cytospora mali]|uniref:Ams2/SPT21 N-terminal domain-containing protein n=1 Tax=Cytospora mali TaxID=578113 RepID=A0A194ULU0_CYTMA|nr:hypothetical protein VP1G_00172 [Valsa mali var. pyri (nom. inval.)]
MTGSQSGAWMGYHSHGLPAPLQPSREAEQPGMQTRPMGLKVQYTFEKDQQNCLARWPQTLQIPTVAIDERNSIGIVDLRTCLQAIAQCSPEIINQLDKDYAVYALDYSEDDMPLVGQGMLSWGLEQPNPSSEQKMITGRVTKNMLAIFGNGVKETLEVKLKLNAVPKLQRPQTSEMQRGYGSNAPTPTPTDEWSSFMQSNPGFGRPLNGPSMPSPGLPPARYGSPIQMPSPAPDVRLDHFTPLPAAPTPPPLSAPVPQHMAPMSSFVPALSSQGPTHDENVATSKHDEPAPSARPKKGKRSSSKQPSKRSTGNPVGRPRKNARDGGNTSAIEDATDGDEPPKKKRAKTTKADFPKGAPLDAAPGSLRVAASTSGSLRTMRPVASGGSGIGGSHLQDVPRAPTPVPGQAPPRPRVKPIAPNAPAGQGQFRRPSTAEFEGSTRFQVFDTGIPGPPNQDARSPSESIAQSPHQAYTPEESLADIGSSPPVPRSVRSSPPPSSPVLPPMPMPQPDSGFMSGGYDEMTYEDNIPMTTSMPLRPEDFNISGVQQSTNSGRPKLVPAGSTMVIEQVFPGPAELLPKKTLFRPKSSAKAQARAQSKSRGTGTKALARQLKRSNTEPNLQRQETPVIPIGPPPMPQPPLEPESKHVKPEVPQTEPLNEPLYEPCNEQQMPTPTAQQPSVVEDPEGRLLRLLSEPRADDLSVDNAQDAAQELPPMPPPQYPPYSQSPNAETAAPSFSPSAPASDPGVVEPSMLPDASFSEEPEETGPPSKNMSRKQSIKAKLEKAVESGQMPTFCSNCGAISTPTWRKIFTQLCEGSPEFPVFSDKPGCVTAIIIIGRDENEKPTKYQVIKKALGPAEDKAQWREDILCNSCGIWLSKYRAHRPEERWEDDPAQIGKPRKKSNGQKSRSKKAKGHKASANPTSEAYFTTDPIGPDDQDPSPRGADEVMLLRGPTTEPPSRERGSKSQSTGPADSFEYRDNQGSTHSRGSGTAQSPIALEEGGLGRTRRLLFPSPKKDGQPKVLGEVAINLVKTSPGGENVKHAGSGKENIDMAVDVGMILLATPKAGAESGRGEGDMADLFGTPPRPSTPPPNARFSGPFKTPTRPTPNHRPITRSISKSIRSARSVAKSPGHTLLSQQTPTKTPRSASVRRHANHNNHQHLHAHFAIDDGMLGGMAEFGSPFSSTLNQLLSEANDFTTGSSAHGLGDLDITSLPNLDSDTGLSGHLEHLDFGHFLTTDAVMPSSPPVLHRNGGSGAHVSFGAASMSFDGGNMNIWESFGEVTMADGAEGDDGRIEEMN